MYLKKMLDSLPTPNSYLPLRDVRLHQSSQLIDPVNRIISELNNDLRHERMAENAYWEDNPDLYRGHFPYSEDYSAFLASYE